MELTKELGGENYVFWGGREGYETLLNTDMKLDRTIWPASCKCQSTTLKDRLYGPVLIEPKPKEPTKHQCNFDTASVLGF